LKTKLILKQETLTNIGCGPLFKLSKIQGPLYNGWEAKF